jgi:hypothetical protein
LKGLRPPVTAHSDSNNNLRIAITGTVVVHALLFVLLAWMFATDAARKLWEQANKPPKEKEITLLFPEQIMPPLKPVPPPPPKPQAYIRTAQNVSSETAPKNPAFISDRNTKAATVKAPSPDATEPMPTMDGLRLPTRELADRDYHDGDLKDDARPKTPPKELAMLQPKPPAPTVPGMKTPPDAAPPPQQVVPPQDKAPAPSPQPLVKPQVVAKAVTESAILTKMNEEVDKDMAKMSQNRLTIDVKRAEQPDAPMKTTDAPPKTETQMAVKPIVSEAVPQETPPEKPILKALPVLDDEVIARTTPNQDPNAFTPHTRVTETKGTIANRGSAPSVDAEGTPTGRYIRQVTGMVDKKWHHYCLLRRDGVTYGHLEISFYVNKKGKVEDLKVVNDKESNPILTGLTLRAIMDAEIPPIPKEVLPSLPMNDQERLKMEYNALVY